VPNLYFLFKQLFILLSIKIFFLVILFFLIEFNFIDYSVKNNATSYLTSMTLIKKIFLASLIGPLAEELMFRLSLVFKPIYLSISAFFLSFYILSIYFNVRIDSLDFISIRLLLSFVFLITIYFITNSNYMFFNKFWDTNKKVIFYSSAFLFAISHIFNYKVSNLNIPISLIIVIPVFLSGIIYAKTRINKGIIYSIILHCFFNLIGVLIFQK
jgi:membrane protease YdiL (CAAX protease family)